MLNLAEMTVFKAGNVFAVTGADGSLPLDGEHPLGVYRDDCRHLSGHELRVDGVRPQALTAGEGVHELTCPPVHLRLERRIAGPAALEEVLRVHSYDRRPVRLQLELRLAADFRPMMAIRGIAELPRPAVTSRPVGGGLRFEAGERSLTAVAEPAPDHAGDGRMRFDVALEPGGERTLTIRYALGESGAQALAAPGPQAQISTDDELFDRVLRRSLLDLGMLRSELDGHGYYAAGVPWYATLFGRDSLITALEMLPLDPQIAEQTLRLLAGMLGTRDDPERDEEPGKVLHEVRVGEAAVRYYGTVDATPLFLCLLAGHAQWTGDLALFRELREPVDAMLEWIDGHGDGLLEYVSRAAHGLRNHGWKDSGDGIVDDRGVPLEPPIVLVEPQGYVVAAKRGLARLFERDGDREQAAVLRAEGAALQERLERFWLPGRGFYAMALGPDGAAGRALGSNQGHLLWAGAVTPGRARAIRDALMGDRMFSGWGIRTLAEGDPAYNPLGYHLGTVWPHDTAMIAAGLRRYGYDADFTALQESLLDAAAGAVECRLPELFAGFPRTDAETPVPYPVACRPQAWAAGVIPYMLTAGLGLAPDALHGRLRVRRPSLPQWLDRVEIRDLRIAGSEVDLRFERSGDRVELTDHAVRGDVEIVCNPVRSDDRDEMVGLG